MFGILFLNIWLIFSSLHLFDVLCAHALYALLTELIRNLIMRRRLDLFISGAARSAGRFAAVHARRWLFMRFCLKIAACPTWLWMTL